MCVQIYVQTKCIMEFKSHLKAYKTTPLIELKLLLNSTVIHELPYKIKIPVKSYNNELPYRTKFYLIKMNRRINTSVTRFCSSVV